MRVVESMVGGGALAKLWKRKKETAQDVKTGVGWGGGDPTTKALRGFVWGQTRGDLGAVSPGTNKGKSRN